MQPRRAAVILAGGRSRRMGRPKAWLELGGETLLHRITRIVAAACPSVVVVATPAQALPPLPAGVVRVDDPVEHAEQGPLAGVLTGLVALAEHGDALVYLGSCDAAWLTTRHVQHVLDVLAHADDIDAVVPVSAGSIVHGTSGAVRLPIACTTARTLMQSGRRALRDLYDGLTTRRLPVEYLPDPAAVRACNEPADWDAALAAIAGER